VSIKVVVCGAAGRMGREVCRAVIADPELKLYGACDSSLSFAGEEVGHVVLSGSLSEELVKKPEVVVDFTVPSSVLDNIKAAADAGAHCVVGTTGLSKEDLAEITAYIKPKNVNVLVAPNFAIGAVLMMELSKTAAKYMETCEIIELHHDLKADAPSGTAIKTAEGLPGQPGSRLKPGEKETLEGARGAFANGVHVHSVRLPGLVAHQEVIFGGLGQTLTIRHDSIDRTSFMPGVVLAIKEIGKHPGLTYGLENFLDI
jgi:4-hydroxy-tetrahydrodipicolinate reductase